MSGLRALWALLALIGAGEACAHATLVETTPGDGAALAAPPAEIVLRFDEPVQPLVIRLHDQAGGTVSLPEAAVHDGEITIAAPADLRTGTYLLSFRVTSLDSHPVGGSIQFSIGSVASLTAAAADTSPAWEWGVAATRFVHYWGLLIAAGGALFVSLVTPFPGHARLIVAAALIAALTAIAGVGLQGAALLDATPAGLLSSAVWTAGLESTRGASAIVALVGLLLIGLGSVLRHAASRTVLLWLGTLGVISSLLLTGHTATAQPRALSLIAHASHAFAAAFWVGSLAALAGLLRVAPASDALLALRRFSTIALVAVPVLIVAAVTLAVLRLPAAETLFDSLYGRLVLAKAALLVLLLALATLNRLSLTPAFERGDARVALRRSIRAEIAMMIGVLAGTAALAQTAPPRAPTANQGWHTIRHSGDQALELIVRPAHAGMNALIVRFRDKTGAAYDPEEVSLEIANEAAGIEPMIRHPRRTGLGDYRVDGIPLTVSGEWSIRIDARVSDFDKVIFRVEVPVS